MSHPNPPTKTKPKVVQLLPETIEKINAVSLSLDERQRYVVDAAMDHFLTLPEDKRVALILAARRRLVSTGVDA